MEGDFKLNCTQTKRAIPCATKISKMAKSSIWGGMLGQATMGSKNPGYLLEISIYPESLGLTDVFCRTKELPIICSMQMLNIEINMLQLLIIESLFYQIMNFINLSNSVLKQSRFLFIWEIIPKLHSFEHQTFQELKIDF